jgi:Tfp pilus assembly protein PilZ
MSCASEGGDVTTDDYQDRRRHRRISASIPVRISTIEPERDPWTGRPFFRASQETCANVSRGGAFVRTAEPLTPGRRVLLEFELPGGQPLEAIGRVAWTRRVLAPLERDSEAGIGIEFLGGPSEQFSVLEDLIEKLSGAA